jgi:hypothetical protein
MDSRYLILSPSERIAVEKGSQTETLKGRTNRDEENTEDKVINLEIFVFELSPSSPESL